MGRKAELRVQTATLIRFSPKYVVRGFYVLLQYGQVAAFRNNTYSVSEEHLELLKKAHIPYKILST